jgi:ABC-type multidrug transport system permease subunit
MNLTNFYQQLGKYLPGKVWLLLGRFYFYESKGKSKKIISIALYFETVTILMAAGLLFLVSLFFFEETKLDLVKGSIWWLILLFLSIFVSLHPRILQKTYSMVPPLF